MGIFIFVCYSVALMSSGESRNEIFRYPVDEVASEITPLASLEVFIGNTRVRVLNVSMGGMAFLVEKDPDFADGDIKDVSVSIRGRAFPLQLEIKHIKGLRVSSSFLNPPPAFLFALREFLGPKFLGASLQEATAHKDLPEAIRLVEGAKTYRAFTGQNQTGVFLWAGEGNKLLRLIAVSRDLVLGWDPIAGSRTGRLNAHNDIQDVVWDRIIEITVFNYMADILLAWKNQPSEREWMEKLFEISPNSESAHNIRVPF